MSDSYIGFTIPATSYTNRFIIIVGQNWDDGAFGITILTMGKPSQLFSISSKLKHWCLIRMY